jgi:hypothetical protein
MIGKKMQRTPWLSVLFAVIVVIPIRLAFAQTQPPQQPPQPPRASLPEIPSGSSREISLDELPKEARDFFLQSSSGKSIPASQPKEIVHRGVRRLEGHPEELAWVEELAARAIPSIDEAKVRVALVPGSGIPLPNAKFVGFVPQGPTLNGLWSKVARLFRYKEKTVVLSEWDYVADGGGVLQFSELVNVDINGSRGSLAVKTAVGKGALWSLTWERQGKLFELYILEPKLEDATEHLILAVARGISQ